MNKRVTVIMDEEAADLLTQLAGSTRKQGAYLGSLLRAVAACRRTPHSSESGSTLSNAGNAHLETIRLSDVVPYQEYRSNLSSLLKEVAKGRKLLVVYDNDMVVVVATYVYKDLVQRLSHAEDQNRKAQREE